MSDSIVDAGWKKSDLPFLIGEVLGIGVELSQEWVANGGTIEVSWHEAVGAALGVGYRPTKERHMRLLLHALGIPWDSTRYSSSDTPSEGGGNLKREAYLDLFLALVERDPRPTAMTDPWQLRAIRVRLGQAQFRASLLTAYESRCAISGSVATQVLEAAHIEPFGTGGAPTVTNGLLLRADIHTLFDRGLIQVNPDSLQVEVDGSLHDTEYWGLHGQKLRLPRDSSESPDRAALRRRYAARAVLLDSV